MKVCTDDTISERHSLSTLKALKKNSQYIEGSLRYWHLDKGDGGISCLFVCFLQLNFLNKVQEDS